MLNEKNKKIIIRNSESKITQPIKPQISDNECSEYCFCNKCQKENEIQMELVLKSMKN